MEAVAELVRVLEAHMPLLNAWLPRLLLLLLLLVILAAVQVFRVYSRFAGLSQDS